MELFGNIILELGLLALLGFLYYQYQKKKILDYEKHKGPMIMGFIRDSCLAERGEGPHPRLDEVIEALQSHLERPDSAPPTSLLIHFANSAECSEELKAIILDGIQEHNSR